MPGATLRPLQSVDSNRVLQSHLGVLSLSVRAHAPLGGEETLQQLHLVQRHVGGEGAQAGTLTVLIVDLQPLAYKPTEMEPIQPHRKLHTQSPVQSDTEAL
jgi:hypothetical protein